MPDYQLGKIYQIICLTTGQKYIGSTTEPTLARRLTGHVRNYKCWKKGKGSNTSSYSILEGGNYQIELLETCPCNSKDELNAREGHYIRTIDCVNRCVAGRTPKEYEQTCRNKEERYQWKKEDRKLHPEKYKVYDDRKYAKHSEVIKERIRVAYQKKKSMII